MAMFPSPEQQRLPPLEDPVGHPRNTQRHLGVNKQEDLGEATHRHRDYAPKRQMQLRTHWSMRELKPANGYHERWAWVGPDSWVTRVEDVPE